MKKKGIDDEESSGSGTWVTADAPMGWPAVFIRSGASKTAKAAAAAFATQLWRRMRKNKAHHHHRLQLP